jgi:hypothetical protein
MAMTEPTASAVVVDKPLLMLLGDPGTVAAIDGAGRGACPIRARVEPGTHTITFTFQATGESKGQAITLKPGESVTMRSDFTGATPTIRIQR